MHLGQLKFYGLIKKLKRICLLACNVINQNPSQYVHCYIKSNNNQSENIVNLKKRQLYFFITR